jgi:hypothetical protein
VSGALDTIERSAVLVGKLLRTLVSPLDSADPSTGLKALVADMGWALPDPIPPALIGLKDSVTTLSHAVDKVVALIDTQGSDSDLVAAAVQTIAALAKVVEALASLPGALPAQLPPAFVAATGFPSAFVGRLFEVLIVDAMWNSLPLTSRIMRVVGLIEVARKDADPAHFQPEFTLRRFRFDRLGTLLSDPQQLFKDVYGWGTPALNLQPLQDALFSLSWAIGFPGTYDFPTQGLLKTIAPSVANPKGERIFKLTLFDNGVLDVSAAVTSIPKASPGELQGLALALVASGSLNNLELPMRPNLTLSFDATLDATAGVVLALRPGQPPALYANVDAAATALSTGHVTAKLTYAKLDGEDPISILAFPGGSRLEARSFFVSGGIGRTKAGELDPGFEIGVKGGKFVLTMAQADGFLSKLLPSDGISLDFDLGVGWSRQLGVYVEGNAGLEIGIPLHLDLGPVSLEWLFLALKVGAEIELDASLSAKGSLGPLSASVDKIGVKAITTFPPGGGNVGPANIAMAFKPPNGVGLAVDAGVVKGGGYLYIDTDRGEYAGALELVFADFLSLHAIGLINTKMPDGSSGFSLLIIITAEFGAGIQLGFGFTLLAVGGLLGLNREMLMQPLMDGVRTGSINSIMFPQDVVKNAQRIISDLRAIFPPKEGTFLIGPMAKIGWGEPTLVSLALGIIIEIPPGNIAILGVLKLALPADDVAIIVIQVNFAGALEFDKKRFYFFASLFESRVLFITIEGEMGVLMAFGDDANFVVSVGGFHPQFKPPPLPFPSPKRIAIDILNTDVARIRVDGYFAVTSNSVQFGAHAELYFGFSAVNVQGHIGFDVLIQFSPFHFIASVSAGLSVNVFGIGMFGIDLELSLEGPTPWHAHGTASISFFFFSVDISIDTTWGDSRDTQLPPIQVMPILTAELTKQSNWRAVLPSGSNLLVSLRKLDPAESDFVLHPVGTLQVSQRAIPLDLTLDKVGNQQPTDANRFALSVAGGGLAQRRVLQEQFAPAQFKKFDDAGKLSQQAYSPQDSGIELSAAGHAYASGTAVTRTVRYDVTIIDTKLRRRRNRFFVLNGALYAHFLNGASVTRNAFAAYRKRQEQPFDGKVTVAPEKFAVALQANNAVYKPEAASFTSQAAADDYLARAVAGDPSLSGTLHVLPHFEVAA